MTHPVNALILKRYQENSMPGARKSDQFKLGLVVEGGGMRGIVSAGMLNALYVLGLMNCFDIVIGSSAGALNGAYFIAEQTENAVTSYYENINNSRFMLSAFRAVVNLILNRPIMDLDYLYNQVIRRDKMLDCEKLLKSSIQFNIIASSIKERKSIILSNFKSSEHLIDSLTASTKIPLLTGSPLRLNDDYLWDGFLYEAIPIKTALTQGCSHLLVLRTKPNVKYLDSKVSFIEKSTICRHIGKKYGKKYVLDYYKSAIQYKYTIRKLNKMNKHYSSAPYIFSISPAEESKEIGQFEKNRKKLIEGASNGILSVIDVYKTLLNDHQNKKISLKDGILSLS